MVEYSAGIDMIDSPPLIVTMHAGGGGPSICVQQHLLSNFHVPRKVLYAINDKTNIKDLGQPEHWFYHLVTSFTPVSWKVG